METEWPPRPQASGRANAFLRRAALALIGAAIDFPAFAAPAARLIDRRWTRFGSGDVDHTAWDAILARHLRRGGDGVARFDYRGVDRGAVRAYVASLEAVDPAGLASGSAFAYWVNLYNAATVQVVLDAWPVSSIRRIGGALFAPGPWRRPFLSVAGQSLSLDDIEHGILRPVWREPRIHFAVNCASIGCPDLAERAWTAGRLEPMLEEATRRFVNHPRGARVENGRLTVSSIFHWYAEDFGGTDAAVIAYLRRYAEPPLATALDGVTRVAGHQYDWALNG
jgi:hypothetical protein